MSDPERCAPGDWVEVELVLLEPSDRSGNLPPETADKPFVEWVKGYATDGAALGRPVSVRTMTGRVVEGRLSRINPGYFHTFGQPIPELWHVGDDLRARLAEYRKAGA